MVFHISRGNQKFFLQYVTMCHNVSQCMPFLKPNFRKTRGKNNQKSMAVPPGKVQTLPTADELAAELVPEEDPLEPLVKALLLTSKHALRRRDNPFSPWENVQDRVCEEQPVPRRYPPPKNDPSLGSGPSHPAPRASSHRDEEDNAGKALKVIFFFLLDFFSFVLKFLTVSSTNTMLTRALRRGAPLSKSFQSKPI